MRRMCGDETMNKCFPSSVRNTEEQHFLRSLLHHSKHPRTFRHSPSLILSLGTKLRLQTSHRHATDAPPTHHRRILYAISSKSGQRVGRLSADSRPTVGRLSADSRPTVGQRVGRRVGRRVGGIGFFTFTKNRIKTV